MAINASPNQPDKISSEYFPSDLPAAKKFDGLLISKGGREYIVKTTTIQHGRGWKVWQGVKAFSGTLFTLGIGLAFEGLRNKWKEAWTGEERIATWMQFLSYPPTTSDKASSVGIPIIQKGKIIDEKSEEFEPMRDLLNQAKQDINSLPINELKVGLHEILTLRPSLETSEYKTTILVIAERVAQSYLDAGNGEKALQVRIKVAQYIPPSGELTNIPIKVARADPKYGQMLYPIDTNLFKNQSLHMEHQTEKGYDYYSPKKHLHIEGQLTHHARANLQKTLDFASNNNKQFLQGLPRMFCSGIHTYTNTLTYYEKDSDGKFSKDILSRYNPDYKSNLTTIEFMGVAKVTIGTDDSLKSHYNNITIDLDTYVSVKDYTQKLHIILASLGLGTASSPPRDVDEERIKIMQLFRAFYPSQAYSFEHDEKSFSESLESLKKRISDEVPEMEHKFKEYLDEHPELMYKQEVSPGQYIWAVKGLAEEVKNQGGIGLLETVEGTDFNKALADLASICTDGSMSVQDRYQRGLFKSTEDPVVKFYNGSADSITTTLITQNMTKNPSNYVSKGKIKIIYDLALVERVGYISERKNAGSKTSSDYRKRPSILELTKQCQANPNSLQAQQNEVHIKHRIPPQFIKGIIVSDEIEKQAVVKALKSKGLCTLDDEWNEYIFGKPIDEFILVGQLTPPPPLVANKDISGPLSTIQEKNLTEESEAFAPIRQFIDEAAKDIKSIPFPQLRSGLLSIIKLKPTIQTYEYKTTLLTIAEKVAQHYSNDGAGSIALKIRLDAAQAFAPSPPLSEISESLKKEDSKLGLIVHPLDTSVFKNQSLSFQKKLFEGQVKPHLHVEGKVSHYVRENLTHTLDFATKQPKKFLKGLPEGFCSDFTVTSEDVVYHEKKPDGQFSSSVYKDGYNITNSNYYAKVYALHFHGVGKVKIGKDTNLRSHYNNISIDLDPGVSEEEAAAKLTIILASLGIGATASSPRPVDEERIKIMQLFRAFYPKEASVFQVSEDAFIVSIDGLKKSIEEKVPDMKLKFKEYLVDHPELMYKQEVFPGQYIWAVKGLAEEVRKNGGMGLMSSIDGNTVEDAFKRFVLMCKSGPMSTQERYQRGIIVAGASPANDFQKGGADSVYTRLITTKMDKSPLTHLLPGKMNILYDMELVERVGYAYHGDKFGTKEPNTYHKRPSIIELTKLCEEFPKLDESKNNEVCIHSYVPPRHIKGALVRTDKDKQNLITLLRTEGLLVKDPDGVERIFGKTADQFVHVGNYDASYWA